MTKTEPSGLLIFLFFCSFLSVSCATGTASGLGEAGQELAPCPASPNCVSSEAQDADHQVAPFTFSGPAADAWRLLKELVAKRPRTVIVSEKPGYFHAQCKSAVFGFVDDLEFSLRPEQGLIAVRSAARTGYFDFGVNRRRVEELREAFRQATAAP